MVPMFRPCHAFRASSPALVPSCAPLALRCAGLRWRWAVLNQPSPGQKRASPGRGSFGGTFWHGILGEAQKELIFDDKTELPERSTSPTTC